MYNFFTLLLTRNPTSTILQYSRINHNFSTMDMKKFSPVRTITKGNLEKVPGDKPGVYRIKDVEGDVLYIGKAKGGRLDDRIAEHKGEFDGGTKFQYRTTSSKDAAERLERKEIKKFDPPSNQA